MKQNKNVGRSILLAIIISGLFIAFINVGLNYLYKSPSYDRYCTTSQYPSPKTIPNPPTNCIDAYSSQQAIDCQKGEGLIITKQDSSGCYVYDKCDYCQKDFNEATRKYNLNIYFILAGIGLVLLLFGLIANVSLLLEITTLASGFILTVEGVIRNRKEELMIFITLFILLTLVVWFSIKKMNKNKR